MVYIVEGLQPFKLARAARDIHEEYFSTLTHKYGDMSLLLSIVSNPTWC
jgi:hypothetical protein